MKREISITVHYIISLALWAGVGAIGAMNDISMAVPLMIVLAITANNIEKEA